MLDLSSYWEYKIFGKELTFRKEEYIKIKEAYLYMRLHFYIWWHR